VGLTWNFRNDTADGVMEGPNARGLSPFGVRVVEECNRLGIIIDVSHLAAAGVRDVLQVSQQPVIASHSNARAVFDHYRNLTDAQIEAIVAGGGLIGARSCAIRPATQPSNTSWTRSTTSCASQDQTTLPLAPTSTAQLCRAVWKMRPATRP